MARVKIDTGGRPPAEIEEHLEKAARAVRMSQDRDFADPEMQADYEREAALFGRIMDAMIEDIEALEQGQLSLRQTKKAALRGSSGH